MENNLSYFVHIGNLPIPLQEIANNISISEHTSFAKETALFLFNKTIQFQRHNIFDVAIIGEIENKNEVLNEIFNIDKIELLKGTFAIFIISDKTLYFYISLDGKIPGYLIQQNGKILITSALKAFRNTDCFDRKLIPIDTYQYEYSSRIPQTFSLMQDCERIIPGKLYQISLDNTKQITSTILKSIASKPLLISELQAKQKLFNLLNNSISIPNKLNESFAVSLSGGVDSGTILGLLAKRTNNIHTFSIGTEFGNEYHMSKISALFSNSNHHEIYINDDDYCEGILQAVFYNELCDPLYAEGYVAFYHFFKHASKYCNTFFTGYGADLILGNMHRSAHQTNVNDLNGAWCKRTSWTGELSPYLANEFNSTMHFPFWNEEIIEFGLSLPIKFIQNEITEKIILRAMSDEMKLSHHDIAWNKKTALTHGTSLDKLFSKVLNIKYNSDYYFKSIFLYFLFEDFFVNDKNIEEINFNFLIHKTKNYVDTKRTAQ